MSRLFTPSVSGAQAAMTREEEIRALQDADRTRGDRDSVIFAAALVADYLAVSWAPAFLELLALKLSLGYLMFFYLHVMYCILITV